MVLDFSIFKAVSAQVLSQFFGFALALSISIALAYKVGAGIDSDFFFLGRRVVTGFTEAINKTLVIVYIPLFIQALLQGKESASQILYQILVKMLLLGSLIAYILYISSTLIISVLAPSLDTQSVDVAVTILHIFLLILPPTMLVVVLNGFCNAAGHFGYPALAKIFPRIFMLFTLIFLMPPGGVVELTWAFTFGTYFTFLVISYIAYLAWNRQAEESSKVGEINSKIAKQRGFAMLIVLVSSQLSIWIETYYAVNAGEGALSLLEYAQRLGNLIPGMLSFSLVAVFYTAWCREIAKGNHKIIEKHFFYWLAIGLAIIAPIVGYIFINADDIIFLTLQRGKFSPEDAYLSANLMRLMMPAVIGVFIINLFIAWVLANSYLPMLRLILIYSILDVAIKIAMFHYSSDLMGLNGVAWTIGVSPLLMMVIVVSYAIKSKLVTFAVEESSLLYKLLGLPPAICITFYLSSLLTFNLLDFSDTQLLIGKLVFTGISGIAAALGYIYIVNLKIKTIYSLIQ